MENEGQKPEKKISTVENVLWLMVLIPASIFVAIMNVTVVLAPFTPLINLPIFAAMQFYLWMKGIKPHKMLIGSLLEFIPFLNLLPIDIVTWIVTVIIENNPKLSKTVGAVSNLKKGGTAA